MFYNISVVVFASITIVYTVGLVPWWAFEPLPDIDGLDQEQKSSTMHQLVHSMVLHDKFSGGLPGLLEVLKPAQQALHSLESCNSLQTLTAGNAAENDKEVSM